MQLPNFTGRRPAAFNMTPMIDVVFLLIIFFLVSSHLAKQEAQMELPLPVAGSGEDPRESEQRRLTMNVLRDGSILLAGRNVEVGELQRRLAEARATEGGDLEIRIRSDRQVEYREIAPVLLACARAGIWNVAFSVYRPEDVP
jgi:biopolymer transport protein ExbD